MREAAPLSCDSVGIAELKVVKSPVNLSVIGLGSCIGVCLYDPVAQTGGIAHVMLPTSKNTKGVVNRAKFADTAVNALLEEMQQVGALSNRIIAKIVGGAHMFHIPEDQNSMKLGERNAARCEARPGKVQHPVGSGRHRRAAWPHDYNGYGNRLRAGQNDQPGREDYIVNKSYIG